MKLSLVAVVLASLTVSVSALAAPPAAGPKEPVGTGNFRRAEVVTAAERRNPSPVTYVVGATPKAGRVAGIVAKEPTQLAVHKDGKVTLVQAPRDKDQPVKVLTRAQAEKGGFVTQATAMKAAQSNGGKAGSDEKVGLKAEGIGARGTSYRFEQTSPKSITIKGWDGKPAKASNIERTVTVTGSGESASFSETSIKK